MSIARSGFTALDGLCMGTRPGALDPGVVLHLFQGLNLSAKEVETLLYKKSGLLGISGISNDMRDLLGRSEPEARLAVDYFVYRAAKEIGALTAALGGIDGLVFTAGIGENSPEIRRRISAGVSMVGYRSRRSSQYAASPKDFNFEQQDPGVGNSDERRVDDRSPHRRAFRTRSKSCLRGVGGSCTKSHVKQVSLRLRRT